MFGTPRSRLIKKLFLQLVVPEDEDTFSDLMIRPLRAEKGQACEFGMVRTDGSRLHARVEADVFRGEPNALRLAIMDISDRLNA